MSTHSSTPARHSGASVSMTPGRGQRRLKNYLLDPHFQLKYSGYLVAIALLVSVGLGFVLWRTSQAVIDQSRHAVKQGEQVVARSKEVVEESRKVSLVVQMNIVKDPIYSENPALLEAFKADTDRQDQRFEKQQKSLEEQALNLKAQSAGIEKQQRTMLITLFAALALLVVLIGLAGIVVTHRVAGPIHKMRRQIREVGEGTLRQPTPLRKGDELVDFFAAFETMVKNLRSRQESEIQKIDGVLSGLESRVASEELEPLRRLRGEMQRSLEV
jgi:nitrogen fixation/metabolism regulation signal transduction histidine kinase